MAIRDSYEFLSLILFISLLLYNLFLTERPNASCVEADVNKFNIRIRSIISIHAPMHFIKAKITTSAAIFHLLFPVGILDIAHVSLVVPFWSEPFAKLLIRM